MSVTIFNMYFYNVLPTKNMGQNLSILLYSSQIKASVGDIVEINIRNNIDFGLILSKNLEEELKFEFEKSQSVNSTSDITNEKNKKFEIKEINKILPIKLSHHQIQFLKIFTDNTFNSLNDTWDALIVPFGLLTQKQWLELKNLAKSLEELDINKITNLNTKMNTSSYIIQKAQNKPLIQDKFFKQSEKNEIFKSDQLITPKVEFLIEFDIKVRIMYIIRSLIGENKNSFKPLNQSINKQLLIIFPEKKYLNKIHKYIQLEINKDKELSKIIELLYYASEATKKPKECVWSMLNTKLGNKTKNLETSKSLDINSTFSNFKLQIICATRSGLFLPFSNLTDIILIDEGNSMYIQDQNSLYYDTREAIFLISKAFNANIFFISPLPSIRLYNMYNIEDLQNKMIDNQAIAQKPRKIKIVNYDKKSSKYSLFGWGIEQILKK